MRLRMMYNRYKPWRKGIEIDEATLALAASMGWVELYHGEWFFTDKGHAGLQAAIDTFKEEYRADVRS
jgi:hypothetical protein